MGLTTAELTQIRSDFETQILDGTCNILRPTRVSDGQGGGSANYSTVSANVACRIGRDVRRAAAEVGQDAVVYPNAYIVDLAHDQAVATGDRIVIGSNTYEVTHAEATDVQWIALRSVQVRQRDA